MSELDEVFQHQPYKCHLQVKNPLVTHTFFSPSSNSPGFLDSHQRVWDRKELLLPSLASIQQMPTYGGLRTPNGSTRDLEQMRGNSLHWRVSWSQNCWSILELPNSISLPPSYTLLMFFRCTFSAFSHSCILRKNLGYFTNIHLRITAWWEAVPVQQELAGIWEWMNSHAEGFQRPAIKILITEISWSLKCRNSWSWEVF